MTVETFLRPISSFPDFLRVRQPSLPFKSVFQVDFPTVEVPRDPSDTAMGTGYHEMAGDWEQQKTCPNTLVGRNKAN